MALAEEFGDMEDLSTDFMTLIDDEGHEHMFEVLDAIETENGRYLAMVAHFDEPTELLEDDSELILMKVLTDGEGEYLEAIEGETEFEAVSAIFTDRLGDDYDFEYPDEIDDEDAQEDTSVQD